MKHSINIIIVKVPYSSFSTSQSWTQNKSSLFIRTMVSYKKYQNVDCINPDFLHQYMTHNWIQVLHPQCVQVLQYLYLHKEINNSKNRMVYIGRNTNFSQIHTFIFASLHFVFVRKCLFTRECFQNL